MKRYAVFAWDNYYPAGGLGNFVKSFDDMDEAKAYVENPPEKFHYDNIEVFDMDEYE